MVKLVDLFNTQYLYASWSTPFVGYLREHPGETIDLAGAKITAGFMQDISAAIATCTHTFIDTADPTRDALLKYNAEQARLDKEITAHSWPLPIPRSEEEIKNDLNKDYGDWYYTLSSSRNEYRLLWAIVLQAARPDVRMDTRAFLREMFMMIQKYYNPVRYVGKTVYYLEGAALLTKENADIEFCTSHVCVPAEFGSRNLFSDPDWQEPIQNMLKQMLSYISKSGYHIKDYLQKGV